MNLSGSGSPKVATQAQAPFWRRNQAKLQHDQPLTHSKLTKSVSRSILGTVRRQSSDLHQRASDMLLGGGICKEEFVMLAKDAQGRQGACFVEFCAPIPAKLIFTKRYEMRFCKQPSWLNVSVHLATSINKEKETKKSVSCVMWIHLSKASGIVCYQ